MWNLDRNPRIYLAGKIAKNDWRGQLIQGGLRGVVADRNIEEFEHEWPVVPFKCGTFDYVGPYFVGCDHGCGHGPATHGYGDDGCIQWPFHGPRQTARVRCLNAIWSCDVFYAWLDDTTAYGTLVEIGYAEALGRKIVIDGPYAHMRPEDGNEMWFAASASCEHRSYGTDPVESVRKFCTKWAAENTRLENPRLESPIEQAFWDAYRKRNVDAGLRPALPVVGANGKNYRLDFAHEELKVAIELDGHAWHSGKDVFVKDRQRQRALTACGWTFIRFAGREVVESADKCVDEVLAYLAAAEPDA